MIKKVVVSAAGQGTRMLQLSKDKSKHLITIKDRPFLAYLMDNIYNAGYREIFLVVGFKGEMIEEFANVRMDFDKDLRNRLARLAEHEKREELYRELMKLAGDVTVIDKAAMKRDYENGNVRYRCSDPGAIAYAKRDRGFCVWDGKRYRLLVGSKGDVETNVWRIVDEITYNDTKRFELFANRVGRIVNQNYFIERDGETILKHHE